MDLPLFYQLHTLKKFFSLNFAYNPTITMRGQRMPHFHTAAVVKCRRSVLCSTSCTCFTEIFLRLLYHMHEVYQDVVLKLNHPLLLDIYIFSLIYVTKKPHVLQNYTKNNRAQGKK